MMSWKLLISAVAVALISVVCSNLVSTLRPFKPPLPANDNAGCTLLDGPWGAEDMVLTKRGGWAIAGSLDGGHFSGDGIDSCGIRPNSGGLWAFQIIGTTDGSRRPAAAPSRLHISGMPDDDGDGDAGPCFLTHGLFLSNATDRLYAVTHHGAVSSVEVFHLIYDGTNDDDDRPPSIAWVRSVRSDAFPNVGINDVVEGVDAGELYVTQFLPFGLPRRGRKNPDTWTERVQSALILPIFFLGLKTTKVHRCTFTDDPHLPARCSDATGGKILFPGANGIAITEDRSTVFVCDCFSYSIFEFRRAPGSGTLEKKGRIKLEHACDNIEWKGGGGGEQKEELWMGIMPDMVAVAKNEERPSYEERTPAPGGLAVVSRSGAESKDWSEQRVTYNHDGSLLSQVSFGMAHDGMAILGSPSASGILLCKV